MDSITISYEEYKELLKTSIRAEIENEYRGEIDSLNMLLKKKDDDRNELSSYYYKKCEEYKAQIKELENKLAFYEPPKEVQC